MSKEVKCSLVIQVAPDATWRWNSVRHEDLRQWLSRCKECCPEKAVFVNRKLMYSGSVKEEALELFQNRTQGLCFDLDEPTLPYR